MVKIEIDVDQILTSAVSLEIEPGDRLLVMNGVIIGAVERRLVKPVPTVAEPRENKSRRPKAAVAVLRERIIGLLRTKGPKTARSINALLDNDPGIKAQLKFLRNEGIVKPTSEKRFPTYDLMSK